MRSNFANIQEILKSIKEPRFLDVAFLQSGMFLLVSKRFLPCEKPKSLRLLWILEAIDAACLRLFTPCSELTQAGRNLSDIQSIPKLKGSKQSEH